MLFLLFKSDSKCKIIKILRWIFILQTNYWNDLLIKTRSYKRREYHFIIFVSSRDAFAGFSCSWLFCQRTHCTVQLKHPCDTLLELCFFYVLVLFSCHMYLLFNVCIRFLIFKHFTMHSWCRKISTIYVIMIYILSIQDITF